jgi:acetyl esterase/lipase
MDLAYSIRRAGWNVLVPHYRGSWGSEGAFSFSHALEDMQVFLQFLREPANAVKYRTDPRHIVLIGHSLGGFVVCHTVARDPEIMAVAMISPWNIGAVVTHDLKNRSDTFYNGSSRLAGTTPEGLIEEARHNAAKWNYLDDASALRGRPVLMVEADDRNVSYNQEMVAALRKAGNTQVTVEHISTDHSFSDHRIALQTVVVQWLQAIAAATRK